MKNPQSNLIKNLNINDFQLNIYLKFNNYMILFLNNQKHFTKTAQLLLYVRKNKGTRTLFKKLTRRSS